MGEQRGASMSSYEITFYAREDLTFSRDDNGNFTVTVNEDAAPETITIVDNDGDGSTFSSGSTEQLAYGAPSGTGFDGEPIQPLAGLPALGNPDDQIVAIGVGDPVVSTGYGFTFEVAPGETVAFDYDNYDEAPRYDAEALYVEADGASGAENASGSSGSSGASGGASGGSGSSGSSGASGGSGSSGSSGASGGSGSSGPSGSSGSSGGSGPSGPPCFTRGTAMRTARGEVNVEDLLVGDRLWTEAHGPQPIRWIFQREVPAVGAFAPIKIRAGTLGADRDIRVSPAHRMLLQGPDIEVLFGTPKALVAAKDLVNGTSITRDTSLKTVTYFHILFDRHEVLQAHGTLSESFFPDAAVVGDVGAEQRAELFALFPELAHGPQGYHIAYPGLLAHEASLLGGQGF